MGRDTDTDWPCWVRPSNGATEGPRSRTRQNYAEPAADQRLLFLFIACEHMRDKHSHVGGTPRAAAPSVAFASKGSFCRVTRRAARE